MENRHETPELKDTELVLDNVDAHHLNRCEINPPNPQNEERAPTHIKAKSRLHYHYGSPPEAGNTDIDLQRSSIAHAPVSRHRNNGSREALFLLLLYT